MQFTTLAKTDMKISRLCLGTMTWGSQNTETEGHEQMDYALEKGVNFWDTAEMYATPPTAETYGSTETIIGTWFKKSGKRKDVILATKITPELGHIRGGNTPIDRKNLEEALEGSLKRLQTDYIDLYQLHWPSNRPTYHFNRFRTFSPKDLDKSAIEANQIEILQTLDEFIKAGKVRAIGLSNDSAWGVSKYADLAREHNLPQMSSLQNEYSLLRRRDDTDIAEACIIENVSCIPWAPMAMGVLSGKYSGGARPKGSRFEYSKASADRYSFRLNDTVLKAADAYAAIAKKHGLEPSQMAIAFCLTRPFITAPIVSATNLDQLQQNIDAIDVKLSDEILKEIDDVSAEYPAPF